MANLQGSGVIPRSGSDGDSETDEEDLVIIV